MSVVIVTKPIISKAFFSSPEERMMLLIIVQSELSSSGSHKQTAFDSSQVITALGVRLRVSRQALSHGWPGFINTALALCTLLIPLVACAQGDNDLGWCQRVALG